MISWFWHVDERKYHHHVDISRTVPVYLMAGTQSTLTTAILIIYALMKFTLVTFPAIQVQYMLIFIYITSIVAWLQTGNEVALDPTYFVLVIV